MAPRPYILLVEDDAGDARLAKAIFEDMPQEQRPDVRWVQTAAAALEVLDSEPGCTGVLLDLGLPDSQGLQGLAAIKTHASDVPIIVLSGNDSEALGLAAVVAGAQDYLVKGSFDSNLLKRAFQYATQRKRVEVALLELSLHDELTGLPRRNLLLDRLALAMKRCARDGSMGALLFVDLDRFKEINDRYGHAAGDAVLRAVGQRLTQAVRGSDTVARLGGDEFVVLLPSMAEPRDALAVGEKLLASFVEPLRIDAREYMVGASIGVTHIRDDSEPAEALIRRADSAMYLAKKKGGGQVDLL